jgi:hypothetical protein
MMLARANLDIFRSYPDLPLLYNAPSVDPASPTGLIYYKDDSHTVCNEEHGCYFVEDDWCDAKTVLEQGYGDCEDLAAYFVADMWRTGRTAVPLPRCYKCRSKRKWCPTCKGPMRKSSNAATAGDTWHIQVMLGDGRVVDPSRERGMPPHPDGDDAVVSPYYQTGIVRL